MQVVAMLETTRNGIRAWNCPSLNHKGKMPMGCIGRLDASTILVFDAYGTSLDCQP